MAAPKPAPAKETASIAPRPKRSSLADRVLKHSASLKAIKSNLSKTQPWLSFAPHNRNYNFKEVPRYAKFYEKDRIATILLPGLPEVKRSMAAKYCAPGKWPRSGTGPTLTSVPTWNWIAYQVLAHIPGGMATSRAIYGMGLEMYFDGRRIPREQTTRSALTKGVQFVPVGRNLWRLRVVGEPPYIKGPGGVNGKRKTRDGENQEVEKSPPKKRKMHQVDEEAEAQFSTPAPKHGMGNIQATQEATAEPTFILRGNVEKNTLTSRIERVANKNSISSVTEQLLQPNSGGEISEPTNNPPHVEGTSKKARTSLPSGRVPKVAIPEAIPKKRTRQEKSRLTDEHENLELEQAKGAVHNAHNGKSIQVNKKNLPMDILAQLIMSQCPMVSHTPTGSSMLNGSSSTTPILTGSPKPTTKAEEQSVLRIHWEPKLLKVLTPNYPAPNHIYSLSNTWQKKPSPEGLLLGHQQIETFQPPPPMYTERSTCFDVST
jgi:hypothetical protein